MCAPKEGRAEYSAGYYTLVQKYFRAFIQGGLGTIVCWIFVWYTIVWYTLVCYTIVWYAIVWYTIHGGPGQGDYLLCRGWNGFSGGAEPAEVSNHYIHPHSGFTQLCVELDC